MLRIHRRDPHGPLHYSLHRYPYHTTPELNSYQLSLIMNCSHSATALRLYFVSYHTSLSRSTLLPTLRRITIFMFPSCFPALQNTTPKTYYCKIDLITFSENADEIFFSHSCENYSTEVALALYYDGLPLYLMLYFYFLHQDLFRSKSFAGEMFSFFAPWMLLILPPIKFNFCEWISDLT